VQSVSGYLAVKRVGVGSLIAFGVLLMVAVFGT
jgi:hypothetical protein